MAVQLYDTTLRDGAGREGISFSVEDKLGIARKLDDLGVHFIEGGWPMANPVFSSRMRFVMIFVDAFTWKSSGKVPGGRACPGT